MEKLMADIKVLNELLYEVLGDMEDLARSFIDEETDKDEIDLLNKLKNAISEMDKTKSFEENFISFCYDLEPEEEEILFHNVLTPFYENWQNLRLDKDDEISDEEKLESECLIRVSKIIIEIMDAFEGFSSFMDDE